MKNISSGLAAHIAGEVTTLAMCWKLKRRDNTLMGFTDHDRDLIIDALTYQAASGFTPTAISSSAGFSVDNLDLEGMLTAAVITEADIYAGKYDFAEIEIFLVNYADLSQGKLNLRRGWLGEVSYDRNRFTAEVRGMMQLLSQNIGEIYSPSCRAALGDTRCKVNLAAHTVTGTVTSVLSRQEIRDSARSEASGIFTSGKLTFTGGANDGVSIEVKEYGYNATTGGYIQFVLPLPYDIEVGDAYSLTKGCDKTLATCGLRFSNVLNFRGEPHVPGLDRMLETAGTRSGGA